jgi:hypothetical protein
MGRVQAKCTVTAYLSDHNSEQDDTDRASFENLVERIRELADDPQYEELMLDVDRM